jgi:hypothetical protein
MPVHDKAYALVVKDKTASVKHMGVVMRATGVPYDSLRAAEVRCKRRSAVADGDSRPLATDTMEYRAAVTIPPMML